MMEKQGIIAPGRTNPEDESQKAASVDQLDDDVTKRAADAVAEQAKKDGHTTHYGVSRLGRVFKSWLRMQICMQFVKDASQ